MSVRARPEHGRAGPAVAQLAAATVEPVMLTLLSVGLCVLLVWIVRRAANPRKLTLANTPGRPNTLNPAHVILILLLWYSAYLAIGRALRLFFAEDSPHLTVLLNLIVEGIMLAGALVVAAWTFRFGLRRGLGLSGRHWIYDTGRAVVGFFADVQICAVVCHWSIIPCKLRSL